MEWLLEEYVVCKTCIALLEINAAVQDYSREHDGICMIKRLKGAFQAVERIGAENDLADLAEFAREMQCMVEFWATANEIPCKDEIRVIQSARDRVLSLALGPAMR